MLYLILALVLIYFGYINFKNAFYIVVNSQKYIAIIFSITLWLISLYSVFKGVDVVLTYIEYLWSIR